MLLLPMAAFLGFSVAPHMPAGAVAQRPAFGRPSMAAPLAVSIQAGGLGLDAMNSSSVAVIKKSAVYATAAVAAAYYYTTPRFAAAVGGGYAVITTLYAKRCADEEQCKIDDPWFSPFTDLGGALIGATIEAGSATVGGIADALSDDDTKEKDLDTPSTPALGRVVDKVADKVRGALDALRNLSTKQWLLVCALAVLLSQTAAGIYVQLWISRAILVVLGKPA